MAWKQTAHLAHGIIVVLGADLSFVDAGVLEMANEYRKVFEGRSCAHRFPLGPRLRRWRLDDIRTVVHDEGFFPCLDQGADFLNASDG